MLPQFVPVAQALLPCALAGLDLSQSSLGGHSQQGSSPHYGREVAPDLPPCSEGLAFFRARATQPLYGVPLPGQSQPDGLRR